ncbi:MAG: helix-turn-helix domain-containing protein [Clostridia bacterium]|nr:helix-turn-helix domain-containing protein [Clostridia bacterium]
MLTKERKLHINILDLNGILNTPSTKIAFENVIHSKKFCDIAKSTENGYRLCLRCKKLANTKAVEHKKSFCGHCLYGLYEAAMPVIIGETVAAVVYIGNAITDIDQTNCRIDKACRYTNVDCQQLYEQTKECEYLNNADELLKIAEIVCDYIKMLYSTEPKAPSNTHWLVSALKQHADRTYCFNPTLNELAVIYHKNEKYMGRLFKSEMRVSFHEYCLSLKLKKAENLLLRTTDKIIDIALECGFNNISYFNRAFKKQYGMSPSEYIISKREK